MPTTKPAHTLSGFEDLCAAAAGAMRSETASQRGQGGEGICGSELKVSEVDAFSSVHDMIHAAINTNGEHATLRQVYQACEERGRIAYKRLGGSRLITHNDHWKSQIRHALYTCERFKRVADGVDLWMIAPRFQHLQPQTTKVFVGTASYAGSVSDETQQNKRQRQPHPQQPRRLSKRSHCPPQPLIAASQSRKRSSRQMPGRNPPNSPAELRSKSPLLPKAEQVDESSQVDHISAVGLAKYQLRGITPPASSQMDFTIAPSPFARLGSGEQSAWQRAARHLNSNINGSEDDTVPSSKRARSAEAESPSCNFQLYALRSRAKPPPGFGDNPDPVAERAAREAHAMTTGPLKKRLKAAAKAAEIAASAATEEATSTVTELCGVAAGPRTTPSRAEASCTNVKLPASLRLSPPVFAAPAQNLRSRGRGRNSIDESPQAAQPPSAAATFVSLSSNGDADEGTCVTARPVAPALPNLRRLDQMSSKGKQVPVRSAVALFHGEEDAQEGEDETDEGGSKRLLRSHAAAAAADLERDGDLDRTGEQL